MPVSLGINPITWTNDDMPELGGDIPLETCLAEARLAGFGGIELGGKVSAQRRRAAVDPRAAWPRSRVGLVQREALQAIGRR
jgi:sugar phosphate isomerase/epimerase